MNIKKDNPVRIRSYEIFLEIWIDSLGWIETFILASKSKNASLIVDQALTLRESLLEEKEKLQGEHNDE